MSTIRVPTETVCVVLLDNAGTAEAGLRHLLAFFIRELISHGLAAAALSAHACHFASGHHVRGVDLVRCKVGRTGSDDSQRPRFGKGILIGTQEGEVPAGISSCC